MSKRNIHLLLFFFSLVLVLIPFVAAQFVQNGAYMHRYTVSPSALALSSDSLFSADSLVLSHPQLKLGTRVRLFNPDNGIAVFATVADRILSGEKQPFVLANATANQLGMTAQRAFIQMQIAEVQQSKTISRPVGEAAISTVSLASGVASYYGPGFHGRRTANGERFNQWEMTAAHRTLPFGTRVKVTNPRNGRSVVVRINDRGPFHGNRIIDLSTAAARAIGISGTGRVSLERVTGTYQPTANITPVSTNNSQAFTLHILKVNSEEVLKEHLNRLEGAWYVAEGKDNDMSYNLYYGLFATEAEAENAFITVNGLGFGGIVKRI
jgi:rare lipoprotein A